LSSAASLPSVPNVVISPPSMRTMRCRLTPTSAASWRWLYPRSIRTLRRPGTVVKYRPRCSLNWLSCSLIFDLLAVA
jgi:hypothetical protein